MLLDVFGAARVAGVTLRVAGLVEGGGQGLRLMREAHRNAEPLREALSTPEP